MSMCTVVSSNRLSLDNWKLRSFWKYARYELPVCTQRLCPPQSNTGKHCSAFALICACTPRGQKHVNDKSLIASSSRPCTGVFLPCWWQKWTFGFGDLCQYILLLPMVFHIHVSRGYSWALCEPYRKSERFSRSASYSTLVNAVSSVLGFFLLTWSTCQNSWGDTLLHQQNGSDENFALSSKVDLGYHFYNHRFGLGLFLMNSTSESALQSSYKVTK